MWLLYELSLEHTELYQVKVFSNLTILGYIIESRIKKVGYLFLVALLAIKHYLDAFKTFNMKKCDPI